MTETNILESVKRTHYGEIENVNSSLIDWKPVDGQPGNYLKVLVIDDKRHRVDFLFKQDPHAEFAKHTHLCTAVAFTLEGLWGYREGDEMHFPGTYSYEPPGSIHTPYASEQGMVVYASFQGTNADMLDILDDDDQVIDTLTIDFFRDYAVD
ncbi:MAG: cupin domain-containing protein [Pseudomonadales bacterium]|nr:cupin domain-containing protein [Pseudomonadales bacterium]MBO6563747.1 cupin domain-containing protein [Pseudomonadales bacterium]MBO6596820.1 cupin domain-containing protein [Pseudomonadales bacterium]MBO6823191.1 cupin domain-containing protein [Pseudomonadales bacterium]